ncbi:membrane protein RL11K [Cercopithecine betaherpesvirus 5]|uniref:Membrane protein RL11K n=1 Tax=Simian cytomegalovirus (strain Colburn) TaxID=50292 RepID=G8XT78_SCMVC|nr:membrane protein RL11K [Cercopithecine betaherpesvirus 5]AEV80371.1 membrane protein RL11K [Cercopithecine betaherpesvirus 5]
MHKQLLLVLVIFVPIVNTYCPTENDNKYITTLCKAEAGGLDPCFRQCNQTIAITGQNVTLGVHIENKSHVFWFRDAGNEAQNLCQFTPDRVLCNVFNKLKYQCLCNYSLVLLNVTTDYSGPYCLSYYSPKGNHHTDVCYNLTVRSATLKQTTVQRPSKSVVTTQSTGLTAVRTTVPILSNWVNVKIEAVNHTFETQQSTANHMAWLAVPVLILIAIILWWLQMPRRRKCPSYA